eukprot:scaffold141318_cov32-Tisochrysis_lutea.AAC.1
MLSKAASSSCHPRNHAASPPMQLPLLSGLGSRQSVTDCQSTERGNGSAAYRSPFEGPLSMRRPNMERMSTGTHPPDIASKRRREVRVSPEGDGHKEALRNAWPLSVYWARRPPARSSSFVPFPTARVSSLSRRSIGTRCAPKIRMISTIRLRTPKSKRKRPPWNMMPRRRGGPATAAWAPNAEPCVISSG